MGSLGGAIIYLYVGIFWKLFLEDMNCLLSIDHVSLLCAFVRLISIVLGTLFVLNSDVCLLLQTVYQKQGNLFFQMTALKAKASEQSKT